MSSDRMGGVAGLVRAGDREALGVPAGMALSTRLITAFFATAFLLVLAASAILYWGTVSALESADDQVVDKRAAVIIDILKAKELNDGLLAHEVNEDNQGPRQIFIRIISPNPAIAIETEGMARRLGPDDFATANGTPLSVPQRATVHTAKGENFRTASMRILVKSGPEPYDAILQVATDTTLDKDGLAEFRRILMLVIGLALPLCAATAWLLVRRELNPLSRITAATEAIDAGSMGQRLSLTGLPAELHDLATNFNSMLGRLEIAWADLKHYADTIAHEMRTPLTRMRLNCEIALDKAETAEEMREVMATTVGECERLTRLLNGLLFLARADSQQAAIQPLKFKAAGQIATIAEFFETIANERGVSLRPHCDDGAEIIADRDLFKQAIANLVSNAIAHTPAGGTVSVSCEMTGEETLVHVEDTGRGIPAADQPHIFNRFYRAAGAPADNERLGLGLAITKSIVDLHGGRISCSSAPGGGTRMTLAFPVVSRIATTPGAA